MQPGLRLTELDFKMYLSLDEDKGTLSGNRKMSVIRLGSKPGS